MYCRRHYSWVNPCGGGVEYLHRDPASRKRWRNGKSQIWDSKIRSRVPRDSDLRKAALVRVSSMYKWQTRPLVREGAPQKQARNCQTVISIWSWTPDGARHQDLMTGWQSVAMWLWLWLEQLSFLTYQRRNKERRGKTKVLTLNKYMAMGPRGARCQEWPCWLVAGSKLLLCSANRAVSKSMQRHSDQLADSE
jgi:hypothetical protein